MDEDRGRSQMEAWSSKQSRAVTADLRHFDEEQDPDPHQADADPQLCFLGICFIGSIGGLATEKGEQLENFMTISFFLLDDELLDFFMGCERPRFYDQNYYERHFTLLSQCS